MLLVRVVVVVGVGKVAEDIMGEDWGETSGVEAAEAAEEMAEANWAAKAGENNEEPKLAKVWFKAAMWECSIWYFKPFKFLYRLPQSPIVHW